MEQNLSIVNVSELEQIVGAPEREALRHHGIVVSYAVTNSDPHHLRPKFSEGMSVFESDDNLTERLAHLRESGQSALLGYWLHRHDHNDAKRFRNEQLHPLIDQKADERDWSIDLHHDHAINSDLKFFVAKYALGHSSELNANVVERRTFAAFGHGGDAPRPIDVKDALKISHRHPSDNRRIVIAPATTSFYAYKHRRA